MDLMSTTQLLGNIGEFLGSVAVIATLVYLAVQIRTARSDIDGNSFNTTNSNTISVEAAFLENAQIWTKAISGHELAPHEEFTFDTLTDMRASHAFFGFRRSLALRNGRENIHAINLAIFLREHPVAYDRWVERTKSRLRLREVAGWSPGGDDFLTVVQDAVEAMNGRTRAG